MRTPTRARKTTVHTSHHTPSGACPSPSFHPSRSPNGLTRALLDQRGALQAGPMLVLSICNDWQPAQNRREYPAGLPQLQCADTHSARRGSLTTRSSHYVAGRRIKSIYSTAVFDGCGGRSTVAPGWLRAGHLAARPRAARRSPRVGAALGLLERAMPPGHAVGGCLAVGALGHARPPSAPTSPWSPPSEAPQPCPLPVPRRGSCFRRSLHGTVAS